MFNGQPKGLFITALANLGERFGYYTMIAIFVLFLQAKYGYSEADAGQIYANFLLFVYFLPLFGGIIADKWLGYGEPPLWASSSCSWATCYWHFLPGGWQGNHRGLYGVGGDCVRHRSFQRQLQLWLGACTQPEV